MWQPVSALLALVLAGAPHAGQAKENGPVWYWFTACGGPTIELEVKLDGAKLFETSFPVCRRSRSDGGPSKELSFTFRPPRKIIWRGYGDGGNVTRPNQKIECDIWLAGSDPDVLLLGVSFSTQRRTNMNTIHIAYPTRSYKTIIERGLVVESYPVSPAPHR